MPTEPEELRMPSVPEIVAILTAPAAPDLFPIGDCEEWEFRELLSTFLGASIPYAARPVLLAAPPEELREHLPGLVQSMRAERTHIRENQPALYGILHGTLAVAYQEMGKRHPLPWVLHAISWYEHILSIFTLEAYPEHFATTQNNLGNAHSDLPGGDREANLRQAIACYTNALQVRTRDAFPVQWAMTQNNLGTAHRDLPGGDREANLRQAIACYTSALQVRTRDAFPVQWAMTQNNLGTAHSGLPGGDREANLRQAIACYTNALQVYTRDAFPAQWATTQNNLGNAYSNLPGGDREANLRQAIACYEKAYCGFEAAGIPDGLQRSSSQAGKVYDEHLGDLTRADEWYQRSIQHFDQIRAGLLSREYKEVFQEERLAVFRRSVRVALELAQQAPGGPPRLARRQQAFETAERAKCRILHEAIQQDGGNGGAARFLTLDELAEEVLDPGTAVLEYEVLPDKRFAIFAIGGRKGLLGEPAVMPWEPAVSGVLALQTLRERIGQGLPLQAKRADYHDFLNRTRPQYDQALANLRTATLPEPLLTNLRRQGIERLVMVPDDVFHWVPFHALARISEGGQVRYLSDDFQVSYVPQAGVYARMRQLARQRPPGTAVVACGPHNDRLPDTLASEEEFYRGAQEFAPPITAELAQLFGRRGRLLQQPTPEDFRDAGADASLLHFFGHGSFGFAQERRDQPEREDDTQLHGAARLFFWQRSLSNTGVQRWDRGFKWQRCAIMTLASCSVGQVDFLSRRAAREVVGFAAVLFERDVPAIVSALWPAQVNAALAFFERFYAHFAPAAGSGKSRLDAYHLAQQDLRSMEEFAHPYQWAPFHLVGADN
jgi:CHAT domain-containing protein